MMRTPVLIAPPEGLPVSLDEAKLHLRVAFPNEDGSFPATPEDGLIEGLIRGAVSHLDGWNGILGRCLVKQTWRMDFDRFSQRMCMPLSPIISIVSVTWRNAEGQIATIADDNYLVQGSELVFRNGFSFPGPLNDHDAVSITWRAGYPDDGDGNSTVPSAIKVAILLMVGHWYENRETVAEGGLAEVPFAANVLIAPFRRMVI